MVSLEFLPPGALTLSAPPPTLLHPLSCDPEPLVKDYALTRFTVFRDHGERDSELPRSRLPGGLLSIIAVADRLTVSLSLTCVFACTYACAHIPTCM